MHRLIEKRRDLYRRKTEVTLSNLGHLAAGTQPRQRDGVGQALARADDHVHRRRLMFQQEPHQLMHDRRRDKVVIVQHERQVCGRGSDVVD